MPKIIHEKVTDKVTDRTYYARLAEPQPVRVEGEGKKPFMALAEYVTINMKSFNYEGDDRLPFNQYDQVTVKVADDEQKEYDGILYAYNRARTLEEVLWTLGGEFNDNVEVGNGPAAV